MASLRGAFNLTRKLLQPKFMPRKMAIVRRNYESQFGELGPSQPFFSKPSMFSKEVIMEQFAVIPIMAITIIGFTFEMLYTVRQAFTRDDVRYWPGAKMACEYVEMNPKKRPPIRKFRTYNQTYRTPPGLIEALRPPTPEEQAKIDADMAKQEKAKKKKK